MEKEQWMPVKGYEDTYEVSSLGKVRSLDRVIEVNNHQRIYLGKDLSIQLNRKTGYEFVLLSCNGAKKQQHVHRLVAEAFLDNFDNFRVVHHMDHDKLNNHLSNLQWCTHQDNIDRAIEAGKQIGKPKRPVVKLKYITGELVARFDSGSDAASKLGLHQSAISNVCRHKLNSTGGYRFMFEDEYEAMQEDCG